MKVMREGRRITVEVAADGAGLVSHAGMALLGQIADTVGLTRALSTRLGVLKQRRRGHDPGRVIRDLAVMLAAGGECVSDLGAVASEPGMLDALCSAQASARERFWELAGAPGRLRIDVNARLVTAHSEQENAAGNYKHGYGFHPLGAYADESREALAMLLRPGNAGSNTASDHVTVIDRSLGECQRNRVRLAERMSHAHENPQQDRSRS